MKDKLNYIRFPLTVALAYLGTGCLGMPPEATPPPVENKYNCISPAEPATVPSCFQRGDLSLAQLELQKAIVESTYVQPSMRSLLQVPLTIADHYDKDGLIEYWKYNFQLPLGVTISGCTKEIPFHAKQLLPGDIGSDNMYDDRVGTDWHERYHLAKAIQRFESGARCPFPTDDSKEELVAEYGGDYVTAVFRRLYPDIPPSTYRHLQQFGIDYPEAVYAYLAPNNIDGKSEMFLQLYNLSTYRYLLKGIDQQYWSKEDTDKFNQTTSEWNIYLDQATPLERQLLNSMQKNGVVSDDFFPTSVDVH